MISYHDRKVTPILMPSTYKQAFLKCLFGFDDVDFKYFQFASDSRTPFSHAIIIAVSLKITTVYESLRFRN